MRSGVQAVIGFRRGSAANSIVDAVWPSLFKVKSDMSYVFCVVRRFPFVLFAHSPTCMHDARMQVVPPFPVSLQQFMEKR